MLNSQEIAQALILLVEVFEEFKISYYIGGSVASSVLGEPRATFDIDVVAAIQPGHVSLLVKLLESEYYIDAQMVRDAIRNRSSFNIIYLDTMFKIDIFIPKSHPYAQQELHRTVLTSLGDDTRPFYLSSPEDTILNKLDWYKMGDCTSKRQWTDISGVLHRQKQTLDFAYLRHWAINLRVADLLEQALIEMEQQEVHENPDSIIETVEILSDEDTMEPFRRGIEDIEEGRIVPWEDVKKRLE